MATPRQDSMPKSVELTMDECKVVAAALYNYRAVKLRAMRAADDGELAAVYQGQIAKIDALSSKF